MKEEGGGERVREVGWGWGGGDGPIFKVTQSPTSQLSLRRAVMSVLYAVSLVVVGKVSYRQCIINSVVRSASPVTFPSLPLTYHAKSSQSSDKEAVEFMLTHKKGVVHFVLEWYGVAGDTFLECPVTRTFLQVTHLKGPGGTVTELRSW